MSASTSTSASSVESSVPANVIAQFWTAEGEATGPQLEIPAGIDVEQMNTLLNNLLENEDKLPYSFFIDADEIVQNLRDTVSQRKDISYETVLKIVYQPQALFRVRPVTRCSASLEGHSEALLSCLFSPNGKQLATGSGDGTARLWDLNTETPEHTLKGHANWILALSWSPDAKKVATGSRDCEVRIWDSSTGKRINKPLKGHRKWITSLCWEPFHLNPNCTRLASSSKDETVKVWDVVRSQAVVSLTGHTMGVTCVKWGGDGLLYSSSQDRTIKVWSPNEGKLVRTLEGHGHWVNTMALNTDYVLRTGPFDHECDDFTDKEAAQQRARERYDTMRGAQPERLITGSDDFTMCMWEPAHSSKPIARLTGHQGLVNHVSFSPDGRTIASASFDKSVKLWDGVTGRYLGSLRGHVGAVYQVCWSGDSRLIASSSKDSTVKVWDLKTKKLKFDLPGHYDEVFAVDWSPDGQRVASGGKDRILKIWRN